MLERDFKEIVIKDLKSLQNCYSVKTQELARRGVPDILACIGGKFVAIELKKEDGRVEPLQAHTLDKIIQSGGMGFVARPSTWQQQLEMLRRLKQC